MQSCVVLGQQVCKRCNPCAYVRPAGLRAWFRRGVRRWPRAAPQALFLGIICSYNKGQRTAGAGIAATLVECREGPTAGYFAVQIGAGARIFSVDPIRLLFTTLNLMLFGGPARAPLH